jgi:uncharacterized protein (DUF1778 family)
MRTAAKKSDRLEFRIAKETKSLIERAAALRGEPVAIYVLSVVLPHAERELERDRGRVLTDKDFERVLRALESPPAPTAALKKLLRETHVKRRPAHRAA